MHDWAKHTGHAIELATSEAEAGPVSFDPIYKDRELDAQQRFANAAEARA